MNCELKINLHFVVWSEKKKRGEGEKEYEMACKQISLRTYTKAEKY